MVNRVNMVFCTYEFNGSITTFVDAAYVLRNSGYAVSLYLVCRNREGVREVMERDVLRSPNDLRLTYLPDFGVGEMRAVEREGLSPDVLTVVDDSLFRKWRLCPAKCLVLYPHFLCYVDQGLDVLCAKLVTWKALVVGNEFNRRLAYAEDPRVSYAHWDVAFSEERVGKLEGLGSPTKGTLSSLEYDALKFKGVKGFSAFDYSAYNYVRRPVPLREHREANCRVLDPGKASLLRRVALRRRRAQQALEEAQRRPHGLPGAGP